MQNVVVSHSTPLPRARADEFVRDTFDCPRAWSPKLHPDRQFVAMLDAYRRSGGLARADEVLAMFRRCHGPDTSMLARWIVAREVICFEWQSQSWLPIFQFERLHCNPESSLRSIFIELTCVYNQWDMAVWFARPNQWLGDRSPVDAWPIDLPAVVEAARADRFVANGG